MSAERGAGVLAPNSTKPQPFSAARPRAA